MDDVGEEQAEGEQDGYNLDGSLLHWKALDSPCGAIL
jgi:hypothetical protein